MKKEQNIISKKSIYGVGFQWNQTEIVLLKMRNCTNLL